VSTELVTLQHFRDVPEALLAKGKLESAGIACVLADGNLVRMDWLLSNAIGGIRLQVHEQDADSARAILDEPIPLEFSEDALSSLLFARHRFRKNQSLLDLWFVAASVVSHSRSQKQLEVLHLRHRMGRGMKSTQSLALPESSRGKTGFSGNTASGGCSASVCLRFTS
jgi:hypothetical protein